MARMVPVDLLHYLNILYIKAHGEDSEEFNLMDARLQERKIVLSRVVK
jgi:hypothetical protein